MREDLMVLLAGKRRIPAREGEGLELRSRNAGDLLITGQIRGLDLE